MGCDDATGSFTDDQHPWISMAELDHQSQKHEMGFFHNSLISSEGFQSGDSLNSWQRNPYNVERYDDENDLMQSQLENDKLDLWIKQGGNKLEE